MTRILAIGKKHEAMYAEAIAHFESRLKPYTSVVWDIIPHSSLEGTAARVEESLRILARIKPSDFVVLLDESGEQSTSEQFAGTIEHVRNSSLNHVLIIGGAYGVDKSVQSRAQKVLSFGRMVMPHQLVRVVLLEQLYRTHSILSGSKYHH